jgi:aryl-alcohol dehydrogenase-like predicted oxidoreductase
MKVARSRGLTPFSVYQGRWNAAYRDMEAELIPMCEDQGMAIVSWASLGGGHLQTLKQKEEKEKNPDARPPRGPTEADAKVSEALENIADSKSTSLQAVVSSHPFDRKSHG